MGINNFVSWNCQELLSGFYDIARLTSVYRLNSPIKFQIYTMFQIYWCILFYLIFFPLLTLFMHYFVRFFLKNYFLPYCYNFCTYNPSMFDRFSTLIHLSFIRMSCYFSHIIECGYFNWNIDKVKSHNDLLHLRTQNDQLTARKFCKHLEISGFYSTPVGAEK